MNGVTNTRTMGTAALAAALLVTGLPAGWAQHNNAPHPAPQRSAPAPHYSQPQGRSNGPQYRAPQSQSRPQMRSYPQSQGNAQYRPAPQSQGRYPGNTPQPGYPGGNARPAYPGSGNPYNGSQPYGGSQRPAYAGQNAPRGHLQDWLNQHQNVPVQDQERMLRNDPSFKRLPQGDQQRLTQQLRQVDKMPAPQRDLRLQRNEMLERLSPEDRMSINRSGRQWAALPADRQTQVRRAFQDLRGVPLDQRQTVLNSARYQGQFTPEERGILSDFLRVEPYQPAH